MAATSYTALPSSSYVGLGSQGDLFHSANYGTYDGGIGSITSHPYEYHTTNFGTTHLMDNPQPSSYSDGFLRTTYANNVYSTNEPQYYSTDKYPQESTYNQDSSLHDHKNSQIKRHNNDEHYATDNMNTTQPLHKTNTDNYHVESNDQHQTSHPDTTQYHLPASMENQPQVNHVRSERHSTDYPSPPKQQQQHQRHQSQPVAQSNHTRSEQQNPKQHPSVVRHQSPSTNANDPPSATTTKTNNPPSEMKTTKSTKMRAAAIKQKEEEREQKQKTGNFPSTKKKSTPPKSQTKHKSGPQSPTDDEQNEDNKSKKNKKQSNSVPKQRKSRRNNQQTEDNNSSGDEDHHSRSKSKKRTALSDSHLEKYPPLPPVRRGRGPPYYDPALDYPYPVRHPLRGRHPYYDDYPPYPYHGRYDYRHRHLYEDGYDIPPYVAPYHDPYDEFFDYEKRKVKSKTKKHKDKKESTTDHEDHDAITGNETEHDDDTKSIHSKKSKTHKKSNKDDNENDNEENIHQRLPHHYYAPPYYDERDALEIWRQERNDYLKKKFKPTIHDVLYAQQWMKSDSYLENQRRRALRDSQGYYFPYKKYTLKDYKDLQKHESQQNPYAAVPEPTLDRKERAKKRQEYASQIERQVVDISGGGGGGQQKTPRDIPFRKPWHLSNGEPNEPDKLSKRERAMEYAKVQVVKHRPQKAPKNRSRQTDPTEQYVNSLFPQANNDNEGSIDGRDNQSNNEEDE